jgi:hypothetical protein
MYKNFLSLLAITFIGSLPSAAQHCPWDCTGFLMVKTDVNVAEMRRLDPVLTDAGHNIVIDTLYGTNKKTWDTCRFLYFDDFMAYRTKRIQVHGFYAYDTMLHFAKGYYVVHYNYCKFQKAGNTALYVRIKNSSGDYDYIPIADDKRIHLHNFNMEIIEHKTEKLVSMSQPYVITIRKEDLGLK